MGLFPQFYYLHSGLQIVEGIEEQWKFFLSLQQINSFVSQDDSYL